MRERSFDIAKAIAIIGIVLGHVLRGLSAAHIADPLAPWYEEADTALYLVHLAVFFFLSGLFVSTSVVAKGAATYLRQRLGLLAWLFGLWTVTQGTVQVLSRRLVNTPITAGDVALGLIRPLGQLWFLPTLALLSAVAVVAQPWRGRVRATALLVLAGAVSLARWGLSGSWFFERDLGMAIFFMAGVVIGAARVRRWLRSTLGLVVGACGLAAYVATCILTDPTPPPDHFIFSPVSAQSTAWGVIASVGGLAGVLLVARLFDMWSPAARVLAFIGAHSLEIFLAHIIVGAATRISLSLLGVTSVAAHLLAGTLAGVVVPLVAAVVAPRLHMRWLFAAPWQPGRSATAQATA